MPGPEEVLKHVRTAFACEPRINLHRYPVNMTCKDGLLTLDSEVEHIVAKRLSLELAAARDLLLQEPAFASFAVRKREKGRVETVRPSAWKPSGVSGGVRRGQPC